VKHVLKEIDRSGGQPVTRVERLEEPFRGLDSFYFVQRKQLRNIVSVSSWPRRQRCGLKRR
jgi:hypothetical protein